MSTNRIPSLFIVLILVLHSWTAHVGAADTWPLVKLADAAVWGTLTAIDTIGDHRLVQIAVDGSTPSSLSRGNGSVTLLERAGRHPDGTSLVPGNTGLFLYTTEDAQENTDGFLVTGGYLSVHDRVDRERVDELVSARILGEVPTLGTVRELLTSRQASCRLFATRCLQEHATDRTPELDASLRSAFASENSPAVLCAQLDLFLVRQWALVDGQTSNLVLTHESTELNELALAYIELHGHPDDRAHLLAAYPEANGATRGRLLTAYARLGVKEAEPWWYHALTCEDRDVVDHALEELCFSKLEGLEDIYEELLGSSLQRVQRKAIRGLGSLGTARASDILRQLASEREKDDTLGRLAHRILQYPYRYGRVRSRLDQRVGQ